MRHLIAILIGLFTRRPKEEELPPGCHLPRDEFQEIVTHVYSCGTSGAQWDVVYDVLKRTGHTVEQLMQNVHWWNQRLFAWCDGHEKGEGYFLEKYPTPSDMPLPKWVMSNVPEKK